MQEKRLLSTTTGEMLQPVRLYYEVMDLSQVLACLSQLHCVENDPPNDRYVWLYRDEARQLKFSNPYSSIPKEMQPIVLGSFYFRHEGEMLLDVRSVERATTAVVFYNKHIGRSAARVTHAAVVNRLFSHPEASAFDAMKLFDSQAVVEHNPDDLIESAKNWAKGKSVGEKLRTAMPFLEQLGRQELPEIEKFPIHFYEEGIASLKGVLATRQAVAFEHWNGNKDFAIADLINRIL